MSPVECDLLRDRPPKFPYCPQCCHVFHPLMRGQVQRWKIAWWWPFRVRDYCAVICRECKHIVGWERP